MRGVNKVILLGNLGQDPEVKHLEGGAVVAKLNVATTENYKDKNGERQERTEWHKVDLWNRQAEIAEQYLSKGDTVFIEGTIRTDRFQDNEGNEKFFTKIRGLSMSMLGKRNQGGGSAGTGPGQETAGASEGSVAGEPSGAQSGNEEADDDLPF